MAIDMITCGDRALGRGRGLPPREGADGGDVASARERRRREGHRSQPNPDRAGPPLDAAAFAQSRGGDLLRPRRLRAAVAGRGGVRGPRRTTRSSQLADSAEHTFRAGPDGLDVLAFGTRAAAGVRLAAALEGDALRLRLDRGTRRRSVGRRGRGRRARVRGSRASGRRTSSPSTTSSWTRTATVWCAEACGSVQSGLKWSKRGPDAELAIPHCHSAEEEAFVVLDGDGTLELWPSPRAAMYGARTRDASDPHRARDRAPAGHAHRALRQGRRERHDVPRLRNPRAERHLLLPALEQDRLSRRRRPRPHRVARLLGRRAAA